MFQPDYKQAQPYVPPKERPGRPPQPEDIKLAEDVVRSYYPDIDKTEVEYISKRVLTHVSFLRGTYPDVSEVKGRSVLDIACGSRIYPENQDKRYDPWMPRLLLHLGARPFGVDLQPQVDEKFPWRQANLLVPGSLQFLDSRSFDAYYICAFPTKLVVKEMVTNGPSWPDVRTEILSHVTRALKLDGRIIRTFTDESEKYVAEKSELFIPPRPVLPPPGMPPYYFDDCFLD
jgi:hypothetical protein